MVAPRKKQARTGTGAGICESATILDALRGLDCMLASALAADREALGSEESAAEQFRGLYLARGEVERLLARLPGAPVFTRGAGVAEDLPDPSKACERLRLLGEMYGLSLFDLNIVLIALAPELDLRYEQLYAYLHDDVTRKRPTVDLALNLLCDDASAKLARRAHFASDSPLLRGRLLHLLQDADRPASPLLAQGLKLDEQAVRFLTGQVGLDARIVPFCRLIKPAGARANTTLDAVALRSMLRLAGDARASGERLCLYFEGQAGTGRRQAAEALAREANLRLLVVDARRASSASADYRSLFRIVLNEARLGGALPYFDGLDWLGLEEHAAEYESLIESLCEFEGLSILSGTRPLPAGGDAPLRIVSVSFAPPDFAQRRALWRESLAAEGVELEESEAEALAARFNLSRRQIVGVAREASLAARWRHASTASRERVRTQPTTEELFRAARAQSRHNLSALARKIEPKFGWEDIQLPPDQLEQLREICAQAECAHVVYGEWGFGRKRSLGRGVVALFTGPPGTGKTMAAEVIAGRLGLDLYKIDLSQIVSKYIGETEKNLDRVFREAQSSSAILFFDEADALFGRRSEVRDAHDRFANIEIGYLLQKIEEFDGVAVLATNLRQNMDEAFVRRMSFVVEFPFPDEEYRRRIWKSIFPEGAPLGDDVEFDALARGIRLSGGHIKNIALAAAFYAAADGRVIRVPHLLRAARREYEKLGRRMQEAEPRAAV